ncbi:hypothetical protein [uncultured Rikenella sp.]|uniref:hypothetical protein n=1 Tax=uncultured Rikenella sp. TaxID=368003 RepID=UPI00261CED04|nr:hypothetical protein [uncultured Rikenella sp.]
MEDKCIEEITTLEEVEVIDNTVDTSQFITKDVDNLTHYTTTTDLENNYVKNENIEDFIKKDVNDLQNYTKTTDLKQEYAKKSEIPSLENYYKKTETYSNTEIDEKISDETSDLLQGLSRELKPDEENGGFSSQTTVSIKNKSGATELIMEIDNLDITTDVATNSVLGTLKGQDLEDRVKKLEEKPIKVIEISSKMTKDNKENHVYPDLELNEDQFQIVLNNNISILKVNYNITNPSNGTETDTLVFYTTIDDEKVVSGRNTVDTIKINAIRRNNEGILVYHGEMIGDGINYYKKVTLQATYIPNTPVASASNLWG